MVEFRNTHRFLREECRHGWLESLYPRRDIEQIDAQYQHGDSYEQTQNESSGGIEREIRSDGTDHSTQNEKREQSAGMEKELWSYRISLFRDRRRHGKKKAAHDRHTGGKGSDDPYKKRGPIGNVARIDQRNQTCFLEQYEQDDKDECDRNGNLEISPSFLTVLFFDRKPISVFFQTRRKLFRYALKRHLSKISANLH